MSTVVPTRVWGEHAYNTQNNLCLAQPNILIRMQLSISIQARFARTSCSGTMGG